MPHKGLSAETSAGGLQIQAPPSKPEAAPVAQLMACRRMATGPWCEGSSTHPNKYFTLMLHQPFINNESNSLFHTKSRVRP